MYPAAGSGERSKNHVLLLRVKSQLKCSRPREKKKWPFRRADGVATPALPKKKSNRGTKEDRSGTEKEKSFVLRLGS